MSSVRSVEVACIIAEVFVSVRVHLGTSTGEGTDGMPIASALPTDQYIKLNMFTRLRHLTQHLPARRHTPPCMAAMSQLIDQRLQQRLRSTTLILGSSSSSRRRE